jgi:hypothetical protein
VEPTDFKNVIVENIPPALLDDFEILASVTSKMTFKPQQPQNPPSGLYFELHF